MQNMSSTISVSYMSSGFICVQAVIVSHILLFCVNTENAQDSFYFVMLLLLKDTLIHHTFTNMYYFTSQKQIVLKEEIIKALTFWNLSSLLQFLFINN